MINWCPLLTLICGITGQMAYVITIKRNTRFQGRDIPVKMQADQFQNGRLVAIIYFNVSDIWQTLSGS